VNIRNYEHSLEIDAASPHYQFIDAASAADHWRNQIMASFRLTPGANILTGSHHGGIDRFSAGVGFLAIILKTAVNALDTWHEARIAAHNDAVTAQLAASDHRVLAELRAAHCHNDRHNDSGSAKGSVK
jgi:hypothetical protein